MPLEKINLVSENQMLQAQLKGRAHFEGFISADPSMAEALSMAARAAPSRATVLIRGESGTGKELVAQAIHAASPRREKSFVAVNCAALSENLMESELFGHEKGAFTGASQTRKGRFEQADGGTLFIDEVAEIPASVQAKLLRVLDRLAYQYQDYVQGNAYLTAKVYLRPWCVSRPDTRCVIEVMAT